MRQLPPWFENLGKRQVKSQLEAHPKPGASWEGFAMEETLRATSDAAGAPQGPVRPVAHAESQEPREPFEYNRTPSN